MSVKNAHVGWPARTGRLFSWTFIRDGTLEVGLRAWTGDSPKYDSSMLSLVFWSCWEIKHALCYPLSRWVRSVGLNDGNGVKQDCCSLNSLTHFHLQRNLGGIGCKTTQRRVSRVPRVRVKLKIKKNSADFSISFSLLFGIFFFACVKSFAVLPSSSIAFYSRQLSVSLSFILSSNHCIFLFFCSFFSVALTSPLVRLSQYIYRLVSPSGSCLYHTPLSRSVLQAWGSLAR